MNTSVNKTFSSPVQKTAACAAEKVRHWTCPWTNIVRGNQATWGEAFTRRRSWKTFTSTPRLHEPAITKPLARAELAGPTVPGSNEKQAGNI